jgi:hypothetical protein
MIFANDIRVSSELYFNREQVKRLRGDVTGPQGLVNNGITDGHKGRRGLFVTI